MIENIYNTTLKRTNGSFFHEKVMLLLSYDKTIAKKKDK